MTASGATGLRMRLRNPISRNGGCRSATPQRFRVPDESQCAKFVTNTIALKIRPGKSDSAAPPLRNPLPGARSGNGKGQRFVDPRQAGFEWRSNGIEVLSIWKVPDPRHE